MVAVMKTETRMLVAVAPAMTTTMMTTTTTTTTMKTLCWFF